MNARAVPPPGWYPDPEGRGQRYWDGAGWTSYMVSPMSPPKARAGDWWGAVLLPLLMPAIGVIAGIVYVAMGRERRDPGWLCLGLSIAACILWFAALSGNQ